MFISLDNFAAKIAAFNEVEKASPLSGLGLMFTFVESLGVTGRLWIKFQLAFATRGPRRDGLRDALAMHRSMMAVLSMRRGDRDKIEEGS